MMIIPYNVEIALLLNYFCKASLSPLFQQYTMSVVAGKENSTAICGNNTAGESEGALLVMIMNVLQILPSIPVVLAFGIAADVLGWRKPMLWIPAIGTILFSMMILIHYIKPAGNIWLLYVGAFLGGITGDTEAVIAGTLVLTIERSSPERLIFALALIEGTISISSALGSFLSGILAAHFSLTVPLSVIAVLSLLTILFIIFLVPVNDKEVKENDLQVPTVSECFRFALNIYWPKTADNKALTLIYVTFLIFLTIHVGQDKTNVVYLKNSPFCMNSLLIGGWLAGQGGVVSLGVFISGKWLPRFLSNRLLGTLGYLSRIASSLWMAFSQTTLLVFFALPWMVLNNLPFVVIRAMASRRVKSNQMGMLFSVLHSTSTILILVGPLMLSAIYLRWFNQFRGSPYLFSAVVILIAIALTWLEKCFPIEVDQEKRQLVDEESKATTKDSFQSNSAPILSKD